MDLNSILKPLAENLLSPIPMCFALGVFCKLIHGGIKIPKELYYTISIYLLMSIGFIGGHELAKEVHHNGVAGVWKPALTTLFLGCLTPITAYVILKYVGRLSPADAAGIAAHYGSTSAVTYAVANAFAESQKCAPNGFIPTLVTILECPGIAIALAIGAVATKAAHKSDRALDPEVAEQQEGKFGEALYEVLTGQSIMLMAGMLIIGFVSTFFMKDAVVFPELKELKDYTAYYAELKASFYPFHEFFYSKGMIFRGALCIFLLEMGLVAGERLGDLLKVGPFLVAFGILWPLAHGFLAAFLGYEAGLNLGG
ncbi:MAG TPA: sodium-dependent bicarbonate transport family permease, partial [Terracidiphilus sp.]|nr:sodium-dependent bicarbonate transport family permease [Terracidiphilus sp.]